MNHWRRAPWLLSQSLVGSHATHPPSLHTKEMNTRRERGRSSFSRDSLGGSQRVEKEGERYCVRMACLSSRLLPLLRGEKERERERPWRNNFPRAGKTEKREKECSGGIFGREAGEDTNWGNFKHV